MKRDMLVQTILAGAVASLLACVAGCKTSASASPPTVTTAAAAATAQPAVTPSAKAATTAVRVRAGASQAYTDASGNVWLPDKGFSGGDVVERPDISIANTQQPELYRSEHYSMDSFSCDVSKGKYLARLHFAETFEGITGPGERVFSFNVQGREFKDFDVWAKSGGPNRAYVETVPVEVRDGKLKITFTSKIENPQINAIELIPQ